MSMRFNPDDYVDVQSRITRFWEEHPLGAIVTREMPTVSTYESFVVHAAVYQNRTDPQPAATGIAGEERLRDGRGVNVTSWIENAETSAIGRALANMGYATRNKDRPSKQEMEKVARHENTQQAPATPPLRTNGIKPPTMGPTNALASPQTAGWNMLWQEARALGMNDKAAFEATVGKPLPGDAATALEVLRGWVSGSSTEDTDPDTGEIIPPHIVNQAPLTPRTNGTATATMGRPITEKQVKYLFAISRENNISAADLKAQIMDAYEKHIEELTKDEMDVILAWIKGE
jgi:hypothetical protein